METKFSKLLNGFRKNHNTQNGLLNMLETWRHNLNQKNIIGAIIMDLSKAFDTINHNLLLAKLNAYGFNNDSVQLLKSYLSSRKQRTKINTSYSSWMDILCGVPQGSILGPILFNIFINDMFFCVKNANLCNYADDNTLYACHRNFKIVEDNLKSNFNILIDWFHNNYMILNPNKCSFMVLGQNNPQELTFENFTLKNTKEEKVLGITIDNELKFDTHLKNICKKANQKLSVLSRISNYMSTNHSKLLVNSFIKSQFNYCPLIWMFCSRKANNKINNLQERSLRLAYKNQLSSFDELLIEAKEITTHQCCLQKLCIEIYKTLNGLAPEIAKNIFPLKMQHHNTRQINVFECENPTTSRYGLTSICYRANQIWNTVPNELKTIPNLSLFKIKVKTWKEEIYVKYISQS